jgi:YqaJ-like viral recombinase domain
MSGLSEWLHLVAESGGKGVVNNIDARALGRAADEIDRITRSHDALLAAAKGVLRIVADSGDAGEEIERRDQQRSRRGAGAMITKREITSEAEWLSWRLPNVNGSEISALPGDHPWVSRYGLWMLKAGKIEPEPENEEMKRGKRLEQVALAMAFDDHPNWSPTGQTTEVGKVYYSDPEWRIGATPDAVIEVGE